MKHNHLGHKTNFIAQASCTLPPIAIFSHLYTGKRADCIKHHSTHGQIARSGKILELNVLLLAIREDHFISFEHRGPARVAQGDAHVATQDLRIGKIIQRR